MKINVYVKREHKTKKDFHIINDKRFEYPLEEHVVVPVEVETFPESPEQREQFYKDAFAAYEAQYASDLEDWGGPSFVGGHEHTEEAPMPDLLTEKDSPAYVLMQRHARKYPLLYGDDAMTPIRVWHHWFFVIGNAMYWTPQGALSDDSDYGSIESMVESAKAYLAEPLTLKQIEDLASQKKDRHYTYGEPRPFMPIRAYPLSSDYSKVFKIPANADFSFVTAALDVCRYFLTRPAWKCTGYMPHELDGVDQSIYDDNAKWRALMLKGGLSGWEKINEAYSNILKGSFKEALSRKHPEVQPLDVKAELPPSYVQPSRQVKKLSEDSLEKIQELMSRILAQRKD